MKTVLKLSLVLMLLTGVTAKKVFSDERVLFCDDFTKIEDLAVSGWIEKKDLGPTKWELTKDNGLKITHCSNEFQYRGGKLNKRIPSIKRGYLEFEVKIGNANNRHLSLQVYFLGQLTSFNGYGAKRINWNRYQGLPERKHYDIVNNLEPDKWHKCRIFFDADENSFEFFVDDMDDPVDVHTDVPFDIKNEEHLFVTLGDYALCSGEVINYVKSVKFVEVE